MRVFVIICIMLAVVSVSAVQADLGRVVYLYSAELAGSSTNGASEPSMGHVEFVETDLTSGKRSTLIHDFFNGPLEDFRDSNIAVSPGGRYIAIGQNPTITLSQVGPASDDLTIARTPNGLRIWDRKTGKAKVVYPEYVGGQLLWSRSGRYLAFSEDPVRIYDTSTGRMSVFSGFDEISCEVWSAKRDELIVAVTDKTKGSTVYAQPVNGRRRVLFKWHDSIDAIAALGDGSSYALCDSVGVLVYKPGGKARRIPIHRPHNDLWGIELRAQPNGLWVAALSSYPFGEPHVNDHKALYVFRSDGSAFQRMAKWSTSYLRIQPNGGSITLMRPAGWLNGASKVVLRGQVIWGEDSVDNRNDRFAFWTFDVPNGRSGKKIFDTGPGCLSAIWYPG